MKVQRIVSNIKTSEIDIKKAETFYRDFLGLDLLMDQGWIRTYGLPSQMPIQVSFVVQEDSGVDVPALSVEVDDLTLAIEQATRLDIAIEYGPKTEEWGVRRFFVRDPFGQLVNIMQHC